MYMLLGDRALAEQQMALLLAAAHHDVHRADLGGQLDKVILGWACTDESYMGMSRTGHRPNPTGCPPISIFWTSHANRTGHARIGYESCADGPYILVRVVKLLAAALELLIARLLRLRRLDGLQPQFGHNIGSQAPISTRSAFVRSRAQPIPRVGW